jgi:hypothetical protein
MVLFVALVAFVLGAMRIAGIKHQSFQAIAHLFVGGLFAWWLCVRTNGGGLGQIIFANELFWIAIILSLLELVCAIVFRITKK